VNGTVNRPRHPGWRLRAGLLLAAVLALPAWGVELAVKVEHEVSSLGADGVTRITRFGERLVRQDQQSWVSRILPPGAHDAQSHDAGGKNHKHMDVTAASRWVVRAADGSLRVRVVNAHDKVVVDVGAPDYANIGFDGQWTSASQLLDPTQLRRMKPLARPAPAGARWYEGGGRDLQVAVLWDEQAQYPRRIESIGRSGQQHSTMVVTREAMPAVLPWTQLQGYVQKEYSDLLD
jgi:hypothetical protein